MNNGEQEASLLAIEAALMAMAGVIGRDPAMRVELLSAFDRCAASTQYAAVAAHPGLSKEALREALTAMRGALAADPPPP